MPFKGFLRARKASLGSKKLKVLWPSRGLRRPSEGQRGHVWCVFRHRPGPQVLLRALNVTSDFTGNQK